MNSFKCITLVTLIAVCTIFSVPKVSYATDGAVQLKIMTFNVNMAGVLSPLQQTANSIEFANADIIGIQEPAESLPVLAEMLGYHYNKRMNILSRYPIIDYKDEDFVFVEVQPRKVVAVSNNHLPAAPYMPYLLRDKEFTVDKVLQFENTIGRMRGMASRFISLPKISSHHNIPVFLIGDFNTPSHLDWTADTMENNYGYVVEWPVSKKLHDLGFSDSYRDMHPNPVSKPAYTWTSGLVSEVSSINENEKHDRIDFIYYSTSTKTKVLDSKVIGEPSQNSDLIINQWPSDHRAVISTFKVIPSVAVNIPDIQLNRTTYRQGDTIYVSFKGASRAADWIGIYPVKPEAGSAKWKYAGSGSEMIGTFKQDGTVSFNDTQSLTPGTYKAVFYEDNGYVVLDEAQFELTRTYIHKGVPKIIVEKLIFTQGEKIKVNYTGATTETDWIGVYKTGEKPEAGSLIWSYANSHTGTLNTKGTVIFENTKALVPGTYDVVFLANGGYKELARKTIQIVNSN